MNETLEKILTRGYWKIIIRPTEFTIDLVNPITKCVDIIQETSLRLRGWDYPHFDIKTRPSICTDYVEHSTDWWDHLEYWRYYQSGQFVHYLALSEDWQDQRTEPGWPRWIYANPGEVLGIFETLFHLTEIYEFATRLATKNLLGLGCHITIQLCHTHNRKLLMERNERSLYQEYICAVDQLPLDKEYHTADLISKSSEYSLEHVIWVFHRFNWINISPAIFIDDQRKLLSGK